MNLKDRIENNIIRILAGAVVSSFVLGFGAYEAILRVAKLDTIQKGTYVKQEDVPKVYVKKEEHSKMKKEFDELEQKYDSLQERYDELQSASLRIIPDTISGEKEPTKTIDKKSEGLVMDPCMSSEIIYPNGTRDKKDAGSYPFSSSINMMEFSWEPSKCVMTIQLHKDGKLIMQFPDVRSGYRHAIRTNGKVAVSIFPQGAEEPCDTKWIWIE